MKAQWLIGIDEAGRGPLAGPVSVGVCAIKTGFNWDVIPGVGDSKKITEKKREEIYALAEQLRQEKMLSFAVGMVNASSIDRIGIVRAIEKAMRIALRELEEELSLNRSLCMVKLDGSLRAPREFIHQETIIGGDGKEKVIGMASIVAKVTRDRHMVKLSRKDHLSDYLFNVHKGYGTKKHREIIRLRGLSPVHRKSFCMSLLP
jgi:ribonuclease HII